MTSEVAEEEQGRPLLGRDHDSSILILNQNEDTIFPLPSSNHTDKPLHSASLPNQRLASLDVFRGLTVAVRSHFSTVSFISSIISCLVDHFKTAIN